MPADVELQIVSPPGRELRDGEPPEEHFPRYVSAIADAVLAADSVPTAFFGHSFGGTVAHETALRLIGATAAPVQVIVSAREAPVANGNASALHTWSDEALIAEVRSRFGGLPAELDQDADLMAEILGRLRCDLNMLGQAPVGVRPRLPMPLSVFWSPDDHSQRHERLLRWADYADGPVIFESFVGGHFYLTQNPKLVVERVVARLR